MKGDLSSCSYKNGYAIADVQLDYIFETCNVIWAIYDDGEFVAMTSQDVFATETGVSLSCPIDENYKDYTVKVLFWSASDNLEPIGASLNAIITD